MKTLTFGIILAFVLLPLTAQKYICKTGYVKFYSHTAIEDIEAINNQAASILDAATGDFQVSLLVRSFSFKKELMQEHFNENYMESDLYPKSTFKGKIVNLDKINFQQDGTYEAEVEGDLTIHGVTKRVTTKGQIIIAKGLPSAKAVFKVLTADYNIKIPDLVKDNIAKEIEITVNLEYQKN